MSDLSEMTIGQMVTFRSKNVTDNVLWRGSISGFINHRTARGYGDILSYHMSIKKTDPTIGNIESLNFFLLELSDTTDSMATRIFAKEWIEVGSLVTLDEARASTITIYNILDSDLAEFVESLKVKGYYVDIQ